MVNNKKLTTIDSSHLKHGNSWWATWGRAWTNGKENIKNENKKNVFFFSNVFALKNGCFCSHVTSGDPLHLKLAFKPQLAMLTCKQQRTTLDQANENKNNCQSWSHEHVLNYWSKCSSSFILNVQQQLIFFREQSSVSLWSVSFAQIYKIINKKNYYCLSKKWYNQAETVGT